jgi:hypothetical protein
MASPPNYTNDSAGYNSRMFKSERAIRRAFMMLGYGINKALHRVPKATIKRFQRDYNKCGRRFGQWGSVEVSGLIDEDTLNALEVAVRWSKKRERREGIPTARSWRSLCHDSSNESCGECGNGERINLSKVQKPRHMETRYVEVSPDGVAKMRDIDSDVSLRAEVIDFERDGNVVFAIVKIPPQADLPGGREEPFRCPCVLGR